MNELDHVRSCWTVSPVDSLLSQEQADVTMLRRAVDRIRGDKAPFLPGEEIYGLAAMDWWIKEIRKPQFQQDDSAASVWNASRCAVYSYAGANRVASYLRRRMRSFPPDAHNHLKAVCEHYDRIALALAPFALTEDGYSAIMGDVEKLNAHARQVLQPVKEGLSAATSDLENTLADIARQPVKGTVR